MPIIYTLKLYKNQTILFHLKENQMKSTAYDVARLVHYSSELFIPTGDKHDSSYSVQEQYLSRLT